MENRTKELFDEYFKTRPETTTKKIRGQIDRPEVYAYEKETGKLLEEMNTQDMIGMMRTFSLQNTSKNMCKVSSRTYDIILSLFRSFFDWYIDNVKIIKNPCNSKEIKGKTTELFVTNGDVLNWEMLENLIEDIKGSALPEVALYQEALIRAAYEGFSKTLDIVQLKDSDIDHDNKTFTICGRKIRVSDRLYELFKTIHKMDYFPAHRGYYVMVSCDDSYFKFPTRESNVKEVREPEFWSAYLSRVFNREIRVKMKMNINFRMVYMLGFYDYIISVYGKEETERLVTAKRDSEAAEKLMNIAKDYGIVEKNVTNLKQMLSQYVGG